MPTAHLLIRQEPGYRRQSFAAGLEKLGYQIGGFPHASPRPDDVLVIWNRYGQNHRFALEFERVGARVVVAENGALGRDWLGDHFYNLTLGNPGGAGSVGRAGPVERWEEFGVELCEWRKGGTEVIILGQRGIGPPGVAQPSGWHHTIAAQLRKRSPHPVRIREHPGEKPAVDLLRDLQDARYVVTWNSGAALKALLWGIPVVYGHEKWIGHASGIPIELFDPGTETPRPVSDNRIQTFRLLGWMIWRTREIESGLPFQLLLG